VRRRGLLAAVVIGVVAAVGGFFAFADVVRGHAAPDAARPGVLGSAVVGSGDVHVLNTARSFDDVLSDVARERLTAHSLLRDADDVRLALVRGSLRVFVAPGKDPDALCLIVEETVQSSTATDCAPRSILRTGAIYMTKPDSNTGTEDVFAVVSDGVTSVGPTTVTNNVAVIPGFSGRLLTLKSRAGQTSTQDLGPQF